MEEFNLSDLLKEVENCFNIQAEGKHILLDIKPPSDDYFDDIQIETDKKRLTQVLNNLFQNAVTNTFQGSVRC